MTTLNVTESEMTGAWEIFDRMRNAVIEGSKLRVEFEELRVQVNELKNTVEALRETNRRIDDMYMATRKQRDEALAEASSAHSEALQLASTLTQVRRESEEWQSRFNTESDARKVAEKLFDEQSAELERVKTERDTFRQRVEAATSALGLALPSATPPILQEPVTTDENTQGVGGEPGSIDWNSGQVRGSDGFSDHERRAQPRDPVTQQFRSWDEQEHQDHAAKSY